MTYKHFALTISPPRTTHNDYKEYIRHKKIIRKLHKCSTRYVIYPEFDIHDRLHYHGIFRLTSPRAWHKYTKTSLQRLGFINVKKLRTFKDRLRFLLYCQKDYVPGTVFKRIIYKKPTKSIPYQELVRTYWNTNTVTRKGGPQRSATE